MWQVIGHERVVRLLDSSLNSGRVSHSYLFSGPSQVGKATLAREFAKALNCDAETGRPCGQCRSCKKVAGSIHPDVVTIDLQEGSKNIGIDAIRDLQSAVALRPFEGRRKVYIIEGVERLSEAASNSLLKTLEEPPPSVVLLLTTTDADALLLTIVSRCQQVEMRPVPASVIESALRARYGLEVEHAHLVAGLAAGRVGWAMQAATNRAILERRAQTLERLAALPAAGRVQRLAYAADLAALWARDPDSVRGTLETWRSWWRDLLLQRLGLIDLTVNVDQAGRLPAEAAVHTPEVLSGMVRAIEETLSLLARNVNPRLALEALMLGTPRRA